MQEENKREIPMVDIDTSGPEQEVELNDDAQSENQVETKEDVSVEETKDPSTKPQETSSEEQGASDQKEKELENYSKDVQRRIAKLTGKWREAQRQRELEEEGYDPNSDEYYAEIDKRMRLAFPQKFDTTTGTTAENTTRPVQTVASATRSTKSGRRTVRLTPSQVAIAKKLGVSLEDYAKQLKIITKEV
jgi:hypothetical protein